MASRSFSRSLGSKLRDYKELRTLPAMLSVAFVAMSAYQFGAVSTIEIAWFGGYSLTTNHAILGSLGVYALAFASSETRRLENYENWEMAAIASGPVVMIVQQYLPDLWSELLSMVGDPLMSQIAFLLTVVSWGVATQ